MKSKAADVTFKSNEVILNQALQNCKDWLKVMTGVNVSAEAMKVVAEKALQSRSHSKAFVDIIGMTSKESDLFTAVKTLMDTVSAYSKLAKSSSIAQQVLEYVFTNVETYGGMEKLNQHLEGLVAGKDRLMLEFGVGLPGTVEKTVELTVMKKDKMSPYSVKRSELLTGVIDLMKEYVEDAGRKYKEAVEAILNLNRFVTLVNEYAGLKKPEDRDRVEQQLMQNPLWENFKDLVSFPEPGSSYDYSLDIKDPSVKASVLIRAAKVVKAVFEDASMMLVEVSNILDTLIMGLDEVVEVMSVPEEEYLGIADQGSGNFDYGMALAAMRRKALDMSSNVSTEEILKARQILEQAGIPEEIVFMLEIPEEAQEELKIAAMKTLIAEYIPMFEKAGNPDDIKASLLKDVQSVLKAEAFNKLKALSAKQIYSEIVLTDRFISANLGTPIKRVASIKPLNIKAEVVSGNKTPVDSFKDEDGDTVYVLDVVFKNGSFMDKVEQVLNAGYGDFLFGELGLSDGITDKERVEYLWGSDVQDHLKAFDFDEDTDMYVAASKKTLKEVEKDASKLREDLDKAKAELKKDGSESNKAKVADLEEKLKRAADVIRNMKADKVGASKKVSASDSSIGEAVLKFVSFSKEGDRYKTSWGTKTVVGLGASVSRLVEENQDDAVLGKAFADFAVLKPLKDGRYDTSWGTKTLLGLGASLKRIVEESAVEASKKVVSAESYEMDKLLATCGFAIGTSDEATINANAAEKGVTLDWDKVNADIQVIESKMIKWLDDMFGSARDEGHDSDDDLVGTLFIYKNLDIVEESIDIQEPLRTGSGTLNIPDLDINYPELIDFSVEFFELVKEKVEASKKVKSSKYSTDVEDLFIKRLKEEYPEIYKEASETIRVDRSMDNIHFGEKAPSDITIAAHLLTLYDIDSLDNYLPEDMIASVKSLIAEILPKSVKSMDTATERPLSQLGLEKFQKGGKWGLRDIESKEVWFEPTYSWIDDVYNGTTGMVKTKDSNGDSLAVEILNDSGDGEEFGKPLAFKKKAGENDTISKIVQVLTDSGSDLMSMRKDLEKIFPKKDIDFTYSPVAHYRIKDKQKTIIIVNKEYADGSEAVVGNYAIGYEGQI